MTIPFHTIDLVRRLVLLLNYTKCQFAITFRLNFVWSDMPYIIIYPKNSITGRSFQSSWYCSYAWVDYSIQRNTAFCFPCHQFNPNCKKHTFINAGFSDWKRASGDKNKGFLKHAASSAHLEAMKAWAELKKKLQATCKYPPWSHVTPSKTTGIMRLL